MAITAAFSSSQSIGQPSIITLTDDSTGTFGTIVNRRVFLVDYAGNYIVPSGNPSNQYILWPVVAGTGDTINIDVLTEDMALDITVLWVDVDGTTINSEAELCGFTLYNETFYYSLTQAQASQNSPPPTILQDSNYYINKLTLRTNIDSGNQAISLGSDITSAQNCYSLATYQRQNQSFQF